jgi:hypothetical protein
VSGSVSYEQIEITICTTVSQEKGQRNMYLHLMQEN